MFIKLEFIVRDNNNEEIIDKIILMLRLLRNFFGLLGIKSIDKNFRVVVKVDVVNGRNKWLIILVIVVLVFNLEIIFLLIWLIIIIVILINNFRVIINLVIDIWCRGILRNFIIFKIM